MQVPTEAAAQKGHLSCRGHVLEELRPRPKCWRLHWVPWVVTLPGEENACSPRIGHLMWSCCPTALFPLSAPAQYWPALASDPSPVALLALMGLGSSRLSLGPAPEALVSSCPPTFSTRTMRGGAAEPESSVYAGPTGTPAAAPPQPKLVTVSGVALITCFLCCSAQLTPLYLWAS